MAQLLKLSGPMMRRGTRFHTNQTWRQPTEECQHPPAPQLPTDDNLAGLVDTVGLEDVLRDIQTYRANLVHGWLLSSRLLKNDFPPSNSHHMLIGCHGLAVPDNITLLPRPPRSPELNPVENIWQFMRDNWLSNQVFQTYDDILAHCCEAWNKLTD